MRNLTTFCVALSQLRSKIPPSETENLSDDGTENIRSFAFPVTAKIKNLQEFHTRILYGLPPPPSGVDVANTLKYFSLTLLRQVHGARMHVCGPEKGNIQDTAEESPDLILMERLRVSSVLKDVPTIPLEMLRSAEKDHARISLFPSLDYKALYNALVQLVDCVPLVTCGAHGGFFRIVLLFQLFTWNRE